MASNGESSTNGIQRALNGVGIFPIALVIINIVTVFAGVGVLWGTQSARIDELRDRQTANLADTRSRETFLETHLEEYEKTAAADRLALYNRMTGVESDTKYISQMLQELRLSVQQRKP